MAQLTHLDASQSAVNEGYVSGNDESLAVDFCFSLNFKFGSSCLIRMNELRDKISLGIFGQKYRHSTSKCFIFPYYLFLLFFYLKSA